jgi:hypothetical protein
LRPFVSRGVALRSPIARSCMGRRGRIRPRRGGVAGRRRRPPSGIGLRESDGAARQDRCARCPGRCSSSSRSGCSPRPIRSLMRRPKHLRPSSRGAARSPRRSRPTEADSPRRRPAVRQDLQQRERRAPRPIPLFSPVISPQPASGDGSDLSAVLRLSCPSS